ncbi:MAG: ArnT family glycosyltransferase [Candidatus Dormibacteria bacterium]
MIGTNAAPPERARMAGRLRAALTRSGRGSLWCGLLLYVLVRVPSWFEPHWYTDEAGYATTAWMSTHGKVLYLTVWNNKPPLLFWIYDVALTWFGPSELGLHLLSTAAGLLTLVAIWKLVRESWDGRGAWAALIAAALLLGLPLLSGDLALPENFLIAPEAWGMLFVLRAARSEPGRRQYLWAALAGVLFGLACLIQQTSAGPFLATAVFLAIQPRRSGLRVAGLMLLSGTVIGAAGLAPYVLWAGLGHVFYYLVSSYQGYTARTLPLGVATLLPRLLAGLLLLAGVVAARRRDPRMVLLWLWLAVELFTYMLPNRAYPFHLLPSAVPLALLVSRVGWPDWSQLRPARWSTITPLLASVVTCVAIWTVMFVGGLAQGDLYTVPRTLSYYQMFLGRVTGSVSTLQYQRYYDQRVPAERAAADWVRAHHLQGATAIVWSSDAWVYLLAPLTPVLPAPPIYKDFDWLGQSALIRRTVQTRPELIVVTKHALTSFGPIQSVLDRYYVRVESSADGAVWLLRSDFQTVLHRPPGVAGA